MEIVKNINMFNSYDFQDNLIYTEILQKASRTPSYMREIYASYSSTIIYYARCITCLNNVFT